MPKRTISLIALLGCLLGLTGVTLAAPYKVIDQGKITCEPAGGTCSLDANSYDFTYPTLTIKNKAVQSETLTIEFDGNNAKGSGCFKIGKSGVTPADPSYCQSAKNAYILFSYNAAIDADKTITFVSFDSTANMPGAPAPMNKITIKDVGLKLEPKN